MEPPPKMTLPDGNDPVTILLRVQVSKDPKIDVTDLLTDTLGIVDDALKGKGVEAKIFGSYLKGWDY